MAFDLTTISRAKRDRAPRIILSGVQKIGKSTFAAGAPNPIFIPIAREEGIDALDVDAFPVAKTFADVVGALASLYTDEHEYQTIVIDSLTALEPLVWAETCARNGDAGSIEKVNGGFNKGYIEALSVWREYLEPLDAIRNAKNMISLQVCHVKVKAFNDPTADSYDQYQIDLHPLASAMFARWADCILFAGHKTAVKSEDVGFNKRKKRAVSTNGNAPVLFTQARPAHPGGGRGVYGSLPYELPLEWQAFETAVSQAVEPV